MSIFIPINHYRFPCKIILFGVLFFACCLTPQAQEQQNNVKTESDLAAALSKAPSDEARIELLKVHKALVSATLSEIFLRHTAALIGEKKYEDARQFGSITRLIAAQLKSKVEMARAEYLFGNIFFYQQDYASALPHFDESLRLAEEIDDQNLILNILSDSVAANLNLGNYEKSFEIGTKYLTLSSQLGDKKYIGQAQLLLGATSNYQGNYALSLNHYLKSKEIFQEIGFATGVLTALDGIGSVYGNQGNYDQAIDYFNQSITIAKTIDHKEGIATSANNIGVIHYLQGNHQSATEQFRISLKLSQEINSQSGIALSLNNLGIVYFSQGNNQESLEYSRKSLALAEQILDKERISESLNNIARTLHRTGNLEEAIAVAERSIIFAKQIKQPDRLWEIYTTTGTIYSSLKQFDHARKYFNHAIETLEAVRTRVAGGEQMRSLFLANKVTSYHEMVDLLRRQGKTGEAFSYAERAKGRGLLDILQGVKAQNLQMMTIAERKEAENLKTAVSDLILESLIEENKDKPDQKKIAQLNQKIQKARQREEDFLTQLYASHPDLKRFDGTVSIITPERTNELLKNQSIKVLEYVWAENYVGLFVISASEKSPQPIVKYFQLDGSPREIKKRIVDFLIAVTERRANFDIAGRKLYETLLGPAAKEIASEDTLCIIPDGLIWKVPFQALQRGDRYLLDDHAIFFAPSLSVLDAMQKSTARQNETTKELLVFANPNFFDASSKEPKTAVRENIRGVKITPLPEAENEGKNIVRLYRPDSTLYLRSDALESRFKNEAADYKVLHFATHAFLDDVSPMYSYLVLAPDSGVKNEDGLLMANEIMLLNLRAEMAVLSACDTALGEYRPGEGIMGMTWAFFAAGVPTTVSSQWAVETLSTTRLMTGFYQNLKSETAALKAANKAVKAEALRRAQLKLRQDERYSLPYYWAGFTVIGSAW